MVGGQTTSFTYDAAGIRVKTIKPNGTIVDTPFPGYEVENPTGTPLIRRTYFIAGQTIATRVTGHPVGANNGLFFFYSDHLGSTSMLHKSGQSVPFTGSTTRYYPFGGYRGPAPSQAITDRDFTGQRENMELGLLYYNARYYLPGIARFISADTIVPNPTDPQSFNRYSYVLNSPLNFTDPTGHYAEEGAGGGGGGDSCPAHLQPCGLPLMDEDAAVAAVNGAVMIASAAPVIGEVVDVYDITMAVLHGDWAGATTTAGLALLPGSSRIWRGVGGECRICSETRNRSDSNIAVCIWRKDNRATAPQSGDRYISR